MRPYALAAALVAALAPVPASAAENTCLVRVSDPVRYSWYTEVEATMTCTAWFPGMALTVCLESVNPLGDTVGWSPLACDTVQAWTGSTTVSATAGTCIRTIAAVVRGAAYAADEYGRAVEATSLPAADVRLLCEL